MSEIEKEAVVNNGEYSADSIQVLEGLEAVRKRLQCTLETLVQEVFTIWFMRL